MSKKIISKKIKLTPDFICHQLRELMGKYNNIQFIFVKGRKEAAKITEKILFSSGICKEFDCQYSYKIGLFN